MGLVRTLQKAMLIFRVAKSAQTCSRLPKIIAVRKKLVQIWPFHVLKSHFLAMLLVRWGGHPWWGRRQTPGVSLSCTSSRHHVWLTQVTSNHSSFRVICSSNRTAEPWSTTKKSPWHPSWNCMAKWECDCQLCLWWCFLTGSVIQGSDDKVLQTKLISRKCPGTAAQRIDACRKTDKERDLKHDTINSRILKELQNTSPRLCLWKHTVIVIMFRLPASALLVLIASSLSSIVPHILD